MVIGTLALMMKQDLGNNFYVEHQQIEGSRIGVILKLLNVI